MYRWHNTTRVWQNKEHDVIRFLSVNFLPHFTTSHCFRSYLVLSLLRCIASYWAVTESSGEKNRWHGMGGRGVHTFTHTATCDTYINIYIYKRFVHKCISAAISIFLVPYSFSFPASCFGFLRAWMFAEKYTSLVMGRGGESVRGRFWRWDCFFRTDCGAGVHDVATFKVLNKPAKSVHRSIYHIYLYS